MGIDALEKSGYLKVLRRLVRLHASPVWWYDDSKAVGTSILHSGTFSFVNTGKRIIAVSAYHVYEQYLHDKAAGSSLKCQFGGITVEPEKYVIDSDRNFDLVTFDLPVVLATATGVTIHNSPSWPPTKLAKSDLVILGGYPGNRRLEKSQTLDSDFVSFIGRIAQSSDDHASLCLNIPNSHWPQGERLVESPYLGGMSGGPVFRLITNPVESLEFAGVIYESHKTYELVFCRHASVIRSDGTLEK
ncbi:MAG: hypothetical protein U0236_21975 [Nitrospira sp.]